MLPPKPAELSGGRELAASDALNLLKWESIGDLAEAMLSGRGLEAEWAVALASALVVGGRLAFVGDMVMVVEAMPVRAGRRSTWDGSMLRAILAARSWQEYFQPGSLQGCLDPR